MPGDVSDKWHTEWQREYSRFNYFLTGLIAAILSFSIQFFDPADFNRASWLLPTAWIVLLMALLLSLRLMQARIAGMGVEVHYLREGGTLRRIQEVVNEQQRGQALIFDSETGLRMSAEEATEAFADRQKIVDILETGREKATRRTERLYRWRDRCFYAGLVLLLTARLLSIT